MKVCSETCLFTCELLRNPIINAFRTSVVTNILLGIIAAERSLHKIPRGILCSVSRIKREKVTSPWKSWSLASIGNIVSLHNELATIMERYGVENEINEVRWDKHLLFDRGQPTSTISLMPNKRSQILAFGSSMVGKMRPSTPSLA